VTGRYFAAICMRGHFANGMIGSQIQRLIPARCKDCGAPIITECQSCSTPLLGYYRDVMSVNFEPDMFCTGCGQPYPWADREAIVHHLENLLLYSDALDHAARLEVTEQLEILASPSKPEKSRVAAGERIKRLAPQAWSLAGPIVTTIVSAEMKSKLGLPPA